jgi:L-asparaginase/Glu-tRNA(Gln) amidotransferase subunit D
VDVLIASVPQMKKFADVRGVQVSSVGSQDMNDVGLSSYPSDARCVCRPA